MLYDFEDDFNLLAGGYLLSGVLDKLNKVLKGLLLFGHLFSICYL